MKKKVLTAFLVLVFLPLALLAQQAEGRLSGKVTDSLGRGIAGATISLLRPNAPAETAKRTTTDSGGQFALHSDTGLHRLAITHTAFAPLTRDVSMKAGENETGTLLLRASAGDLQGITVRARKPLIEQTEDRIIYNAENDPAAKTESATDILRKTPLVTVDGDGNVQVNGQANFRVLLNGRETSMFSTNVKEALRNFPGAVISRIEVITSPSAKYDAEGVGGIVNIITQKRVVGYNASISSYYSTLGNYVESASLNLKAGRTGISAYANASGAARNLTSFTSSETLPLIPASYSRRLLRGERNGRNLGENANLEIVFDIDSLNTVAAYGTLGRTYFRHRMNQDVVTEHPSGPAGQSFLYQENTFASPSSGVGADFMRKFPRVPGKELAFRFNGQFSRNNGDISSIQEGMGKERQVANTSRATNREITFQVDYTQPLKNKQKLESGVKAIIRNASSDYASLIRYAAAGPFQPNPANSDGFRYRQQVYSLYGSYSLSPGRYNLRTGLRAEFTAVDGDFSSSSTTVGQRYVNLVPNVLLSRKFSSLYTLTANYNMRLQRPYITSLNPFVNNNDSLNISYGNPELGPQVLHALSVQNRFTPGKLFAMVNLVASYTGNSIIQFTTFHPASGMAATTPGNIGREFQVAGSLSLNTPLGSKLNVGLNALLRYNRVENRHHLLQRRQGVTGSAFANFNWKVVGKFTLSGSGGFSRSPYTLVNAPAGLAFYQVNFGYKFPGDKLSVTMNVNNFHNAYMRVRMTTEDPAFTIRAANEIPYRVIFFGATYNFGKLKENVSKKKGVNNDDLVQ